MEREAAALVDAAVRTGQGPPLAISLEELSQALQAEDYNTADSSMRRGRRPHRLDLQMSGSVDGGIAASGRDGAATGGNTVKEDRLLGPMLAAAAAAGVPPSVGLPLTPSNLRTLLRHHPCGALRRAVYEAGLLPRMAAALRHWGELAAVRRRLAALQGYSSFAELSYSREGLAVSDEGAVLALLQDLAEALRPAANAEVQRLREALMQANDGEEEKEEEEEGRVDEGEGKEGEEKDANSNALGKLADAGADEEAGGGGAPGSLSRNLPIPGSPALLGPELGLGLAPWDVDYAQGLLMRRRRLPPDFSEMEPYMHLDNVLYGLSDVLYDLMRVRLEVNRAAGSADTHDVHDREFSLAEVWDPRVVRVTVWTERCFAGTVYLDFGTGYGTRQLRFPAGVLAPSAGDAAASPQEVMGFTQAAAGKEERGDRYDVRSEVSSSSRSVGVPGDSGDVPPYASTPAVAIGLQCELRDGCAGSPSALHELLHEMGHALHLILSSAPKPLYSGSAAFVHCGGLQLPLDLLEVPSSLLQMLAYDPAVLARICRQRPARPPRRSTPEVCREGAVSHDVKDTASVRTIGEAVPASAAPMQWTGLTNDEGYMPRELCDRVAAWLAAEHCGAVAILHKVLASLVDQVLHSEAVTAPDSNGRKPQMRVDVVSVWQAVRQAYGVVPGCTATLKELAALPALAHHQATFHCYLIGLMAASALRQAHPLELSPGWPPPPLPSPPSAPRGAVTAASADVIAAQSSLTSATFSPQLPLASGSQPSFSGGLPSSDQQLRSCDSALSGLAAGGHADMEPAGKPAAQVAPAMPPWGGMRELVFEAGGCSNPTALLVRMLAAIPRKPLSNSPHATVHTAYEGKGAATSLENVAPVIPLLARFAGEFVGAEDKDGWTARAAVPTEGA
ncbi:hypothetical protein VaNZ11_014570 [Volvox africanus]|uniref:Peptidase M3A/M3B catalytic domain-containing protein n=1 Tax=Volvox africanus TaxID=51714 RepID=A0ABQ5SK48_9CHLO|nr:hypothetical protein VaNZ11_014570 [Volvox africanus]